MKQIKRSNVKFKDYAQNQIMLIPPSLEEMINVNYPVRIVNQVIDKIDIDPLFAKYKGGGTSSYHPRMLLKVVVFAYLSNIYSSRRMEAALKENIHFMWISGMNTPDHNTINRFRSERLKGVLKQVFGKVVELLVAEGLVNLKEVYVDGTKIESKANRYTLFMRMKDDHMRNGQLRLLKAKARALLLSEEGIKHRKKRPCDVEPVFGNIKYNKGFKRFMLRGCDKVEIEAGLLSIAHNLKKWSC
jgi:transposase